MSRRDFFPYSLPKAGHLLRYLNARLILNLVRERGSVSRARLADSTGLSRATVSSVVRLLIRQGLVREVGTAPPGKIGRREILLQLNREDYLVLAIDIGSLFTRVGLVDLAGGIVKSVRFSTPRPERRDGCLAVIQRRAADLLHSLGHRRRNVRALGVCLPGQVDVDRGVLNIAYNLPGWHDVPVRELFQQRFRLPVHVENNANAMAVGEALFGGARHVRNFVLVSVGGGVGAGVFVNGELFRGENGAAGEIGHMRVNAVEGIPCTCGQIGCLETLASSRAVDRYIHDAIQESPRSSLAQRTREAGRPLTPEMLARLGEAGDPLAQAIFGRVGRWLGVGVGNLINFYNPRKVIIAGGLARAGPILIEPLQKEAMRQALGVPARIVEFLPTEHGEQAGLVGAAAAVLAGLTSTPRLDYLEYLRGRLTLGNAPLSAGGE